MVIFYLYLFFDFLLQKYSICGLEILEPNRFFWLIFYLQVRNYNFLCILEWHVSYQAQSLVTLQKTLHVWRRSIMTVMFRVSQNFAWCWTVIFRGRRNIWWCCSVTFRGKRNIWWRCSVSFLTSGDAGVWLLMARALFHDVGVSLFRNQGNIWWLVDSRSAKRCILPYKMGED